MIALGCDHGALELKEVIKKHLESRGLEYKDFGCYDFNSCDYPDYAEKAARAVVSGECDKGIVICTTGIGVYMSANKIKGIRCVLLHDTYSARVSREQFDTNVMAMGAAVVGENLALEIVDTWLDTAYVPNEDNQRRIDKMMALEKE